MALLKHGLDIDNEIVSINDVTSGLDCNCKCPSCGEKLVAKKGDIKQWHFAHNSNESCEYAEQTAVHLIAKDIIAKHGVFLPKITPLLKEFPINTIKLFSIDKCSFIEKKIITETGQLIRFNNARIEKKIGNIIPDILGEYNGVTILIEIAVTHFIDSIKLEKLKTLGLPCLEIDCSHLRNSENLDQDLKEFLLKNEAHRKWIANPNYTIIDFDIFLDRVNRNLLIHSKKQKVWDYERNAKYFYRMFKESQKGDIGGIEIEIEKMDIDCFYFVIKNPFFESLDLGGIGNWYIDDDSGSQIIDGIPYFTSAKECKETALDLISKEWKNTSRNAYKELEQAKIELANLEKDYNPKIEVIIKCEI